jgi:hypothetical protein
MGTQLVETLELVIRIEAVALALLFVATLTAISGAILHHQFLPVLYFAFMRQLRAVLLVLWISRADFFGHHTSETPLPTLQTEPSKSPLKMVVTSDDGKFSYRRLL